MFERHLSGKAAKINSVKYECMLALILANVSITMPVFAKENSLGSAKPFAFAGRPVVNGSAPDCSAMNEPVTEALRIVVTADGHLAAGGKRIRMYGTNISSIPSKDDAAYWAHVLASQGFNIVRFHHLDSNWADGFLTRDAAGREMLNEKKLDDFDFFFNELKKVGIYSDINMLTGRDMKSADGFPKALDAFDWKERHAWGFWNEAALEKQRWYARTILTHVNPYTGLTYAEDPAAAIVEINNENGLLASYENGTIDKYPSSLLKELEDKWNAWLLEKGESYESLSKKYNYTAPRGAVLIAKNSSWNIEHQGGSDAALTQKGTVLTVKVKKNGSQSWHVQLDNGTWSVKENKMYTLTFKARASKDATVGVYVMMNHDPWHNLNFSRDLKLTRAWQSYRFVVTNFTADKKARLTFSNMGLQQGTTFEFADVELAEGGECDFVKCGMNEKNVSLLSLSDSSGVPPAYKNLFMNFLYDTERTYWKTMREYIRTTLGVKALQMGTIVSTSTTGLMQEFDIIDSHAYWHHPSFPVTSWDMSHYYVDNTPLVQALDGGTLTDLATQRVYGKPFSVTEYDHPYPSQYSAEMIPLFASFASFQDWDMIFNFAYDISQRVDKTSGGDAPKINGYFDQANNPAKTPANTVGARIFRNFLVKPGEKLVYAIKTRESEREKLNDSQSWDIAPPRSFNLLPEYALVHQVGFVWGETEADAAASLANLADREQKNAHAVVNVAECKNEYNQIVAARKAGKVTVSDTDEIVWNAVQSYFTVHGDKAFVTVAFSSAAAALRASTSAVAQVAGGAGTPAGAASDVRAQKHSRASAYISFVPADDFGVVAGAEYASDKYLMFSCSWSGNTMQRSTEYGKKFTGNAREATVIRSPIRLTTDATLGRAPAIALASEGTLLVQPTWPVPELLADKRARNQCVYRLYALNGDGTRGAPVASAVGGSAESSTALETAPAAATSGTALETGASSTDNANDSVTGALPVPFSLHRNSGTLWYELEIIRAQN
jgi:hypothetical protein